MKGLITITARLIRAGQRMYTKKWSFFGVFVLVFFVCVSILAHFDLLPSTPSEVLAKEDSNALDTTVQTPEVTLGISSQTVSELPTKITIPAIGLSATIANPATTDSAVLDQALLSGAVRYPTSAKLGEIGNVVLFGHSSYLPIVGNQAYKTFNGIQKLKAGDSVIVASSDTAYTYVVRSVTKESIDDAVIPLMVTGRVLTLSTCDSFTVKTDRFIVVADFVESHPSL